MSIHEAAVRKLENLIQQKAAPFPHLIDYNDRSIESVGMDQTHTWQYQLHIIRKALDTVRFADPSFTSQWNEWLPKEQGSHSKGLRAIDRLELHADQEGSFQLTISSWS